MKIFTGLTNKITTIGRFIDNLFVNFPLKPRTERMLLYGEKKNSQAERIYSIHKKGEINTTEHFKNLLEVDSL